MSLEKVQNYLDESFLNQCIIEAIIGEGLDGIITKYSKKEGGSAGVLKLPHKDLSQEISILSQLAPHPNVVVFNGTQQTKKGKAVLLEFLEGQDLFSLMEKEENLDENTARTILRQVLSALQSLHSQDIVHRDIKLENIIVSPKSVVKIVDFALSAHIPNDTSLSELSGTPSYLAPEMINKSLNPGVDGYGRKVDLWACGVILYAMLSGTFPFWHEKQLRVYQLIQEGNVDFSDEGWDEISEDAKDLIRLLLTLDPNSRPTASETLKHSWFGIVEEK